MQLTKGLAKAGLRQSAHRDYPSWIVRKILPFCVLLASCQRTPPATDIPNVQNPSAPPPPETQAPPPPPSNSYLAQIPPDVTNQLVNLGVNIVIPTYLTPNMTLASYGVGETSETSTPYYWLVYRDDQQRCFAIEYAASGTNDISLENQEPLDSMLFGEGYRLYHGKFPNGESGELPEPDLFTDWLTGEDGFYRLIGAGLINAQDYGQGDCSNLTVKEAMTVAESLNYLATDIRTLEAIPAKPSGLENNVTP
ncbi:hypothetical protein D0962_10745 [Leptolyngbyaceae cyanobacterium CCMR0082]|uniref:Uncharacterized protein n=1 Tax=Adonisia turfae CCMR0082 TaxID=2304604 RepID=A0A6M0S4E1_9CYAN|nr:hypothetical protein [Adonisia turfae]NEZ63255.1 hypothetical protein [Adonisia turfae CCMR0082]